MDFLTIRDLSNETHRALVARAELHGRSVEGEVREILETALRPEGPVQLGSLLAQIGRAAGEPENDGAFERLRDGAPVGPIGFD